MNLFDWPGTVMFYIEKYIVKPFLYKRRTVLWLFSWSCSIYNNGCLWRSILERKKCDNRSMWAGALLLWLSLPWHFLLSHQNEKPHWCFKKCIHKIQPPLRPSSFQDKISKCVLHVLSLNKCILSIWFLNTKLCLSSWEILVEMCERKR